ncbi:MAG: flagellar biosynthesis anti-sigma factor FlgM [Leptospiraceae bacterium]|nr:flagellar biosynthesis anti-sigma factor FlgM [Leptospiraceae bacterium]MCP5512265.1 flagellar biosynthesis anti-sigma factor FlgM [Leptospiraceae bacterium]
MMIDRIKSFGQGLETKKTSPSRNINNAVGNDNIRISEEAKLMAEEVKLKSDVDNIKKSMLSQPDLERISKVQQLKADIKNGEYDFDSYEKLNSTAETLIYSFLSN